jgi:hypothetical protein
VSAARDLLAGWRAQRARARVPKAAETEVPEHADTDAAALAALGPDLAEELAAMREHYSAPPSARPYRPTDDDPYRDGLLVASRMRPSSWAGSTPPPPHQRGSWMRRCDMRAGEARWPACVRTGNQVARQVARPRGQGSLTTAQPMRAAEARRVPR